MLKSLTFFGDSDPSAWNIVSIFLTLFAKRENRMKMLEPFS